MIVINDMRRAGMDSIDACRDYTTQRGLSHFATTFNGSMLMGTKNELKEASASRGIVCIHPTRYNAADRSSWGCQWLQAQGRWSDEEGGER